MGVFSIVKTGTMNIRISEENNMKKVSVTQVLIALGVVLVVIGAAIFLKMYPEPSSELSHVVLGANDEPVGGAYVFVQDLVIKTDLDGRWDGSLVSGGPVVVLAEGYEYYNRTTLSEMIYLNQKSKQSVLVYAYDENGPLADAYLFALDPNSFELDSVHKTDSNGLAWYPEQQQGWTMFWVVKEGYELGWMYEQVAEESGSFAIELTQGSSAVSVSEPWKLPFVKTAHAQGAGQVNVQAQAPVDPMVLQAQISALFEQITAIQMELTSIEPTPVSAFDPPVGDSVSALTQYVDSFHSVLGSNGPENGSFYGPVTSSSVGKWQSNQTVIVSQDDFFGPVSRSKYSSLVAIALPPPSSSDTDTTTVVVGKEIGSTSVTPFNPVEFEISEGETIEIQVESIEFVQEETVQNEIVQDEGEQIEHLEVDRAGVDGSPSEQSVFDVPAETDEGTDLEPWQFEPEWTPSEEEVESVVEIVEEEVVVVEEPVEEVIEEVVDESVEEIEDVIEDEVSFDDEEDEEEFVYICCYDPSYPDAPYFIPFLGDRCEDFPGAYQVNIPESECANDWLVDW